MGSWGMLTDYVTGQAIRPATRAEWERTRDVVRDGGPGAYTGAWRDSDGRTVYVDGGPEITPQQ